MSLVTSNSLKYYYLDPDMDEDEIEMAQRKLKKSMADLKIKD